VTFMQCSIRLVGSVWLQSTFALHLPRESHVRFWFSGSEVISNWEIPTSENSSRHQGSRGRAFVRLCSYLGTYLRDIECVGCLKFVTPLFVLHAWHCCCLLVRLVIPILERAICRLVGILVNTGNARAGECLCT
jgi:hypothetical protein